jgi:hypothetical protein
VHLWSSLVKLEDV